MDLSLLATICLHRPTDIGKGKGAGFLPDKDLEMQEGLEGAILRLAGRPLMLPRVHPAGGDSSIGVRASVWCWRIDFWLLKVSQERQTIQQNH